MMSSGVRKKLLKLSLVLVTAFGACTLAQEAPMVDALKFGDVKRAGVSKDKDSKLKSSKSSKKSEDALVDDFDDEEDEKPRKGKSKKQSFDDDLDDEDDDFDDEEDEKPRKGKSKKKSFDDDLDDDDEFDDDFDDGDDEFDDDDEEVKPKKAKKTARRLKKKRKSSSKGKKKQAKKKKIDKKAKTKKESKEPADLGASVPVKEPAAPVTPAAPLVLPPAPPVVARPYKLYNREEILGTPGVRSGVADSYYSAKDLGNNATGSSNNADGSSTTDSEKPPMILCYQEADLENKTANGSLAQKACIYYSPTFLRNQYKIDEDEIFNKISFEITDGSGNKYTYLGKNDKYVKGPFPIGDFVEIELALGFDNFDENLTVSPGFWLRNKAGYVVKLYAGEEIDEQKLMARVDVVAQKVDGWIEASGFDGGLAYSKEGGELLKSFKHPSVFDFNYYNLYFARINLNGLKRSFN